MRRKRKYISLVVLVFVGDNKAEETSSHGVNFSQFIFPQAIVPID